MDVSSFPPAPWAVEGITNAIESNENPYTHHCGDFSVRNTLSERLSRVTGIDALCADNLLLTTGAQGALSSTLESISSSGEQALIVDPDFPRYYSLCEHLGLDIDRWTYNPDKGFEGLVHAAADSSSKFVVLSNPNNPLGFTVPPSILEEIVGILKGRKGYLLVDTLYGRSSFDYPTSSSLAHCVAGELDSQAIVLGPAKVESMTGFRIGAVLGSDELIRVASQVHRLHSNRAPSYSQFALRKWFGPEDNEFVSSRVKELASSRALLLAIAEESQNIDAFSGAAGIYAMLRPRGRRVSGFLLEDALFRQAGIIAGAGERYGSVTGGSVRICFAQDEGRLVRAMSGIDAVFESFEGASG